MASPPSPPPAKKRRVALPPVSKSFLAGGGCAGLLGGAKPRQDAIRAAGTRAKEADEEERRSCLSGRKRQVPHIEGNFPSFVFVKGILDIYHHHHHHHH